MNRHKLSLLAAALLTISTSISAQELHARWDELTASDWPKALQQSGRTCILPIGILENMSHFVCPKCNTESDIFGKGGGESLAKETNVPFLGRIPIYEPIRVGGDTGVPILIGEPKSHAAQAFRAAAEQLAGARGH